MKPSLQFSVPCLNIPEEARLPSFENVFYELPSPDFPFTVDFFLANGWCAGQGRFVQEVRLLTPAGQVLVQTGQQAFELPHELQPYMVINKFQGLQFDAPGVYRIQVLLDGEPRLDYQLEIRQFLQTTEPSDATRPESQPPPEPAQPATSQEDGFLSPSVPPGYKPGPT